MINKDIRKESKVTKMNIDGSSFEYSISKKYIPDKVNQKFNDIIEVNVKYGNISMTQVIDDNNDIQHIINYFKIFRDDIIIILESIITMGYVRMILNNTLVSVFISVNDENKFMMYPWQYNNEQQNGQNGTEIDILKLLTQMDCLEFDAIPSFYYVSDYKEPDDFISFTSLTNSIVDLLDFYEKYSEKEITDDDIILEQKLYNAFSEKISCTNRNIKILDVYECVLCIEPDINYVITKDALEDYISTINTNRELFYAKSCGLNE